MPSASVKAPLLDSVGKSSKQVTLDAEQGLLLVKGAVPGPKNGIVEVREERAHAKR